MTSNSFSEPCRESLTGRRIIPTCPTPRWPRSAVSHSSSPPATLKDNPHQARSLSPVIELAPRFQYDPPASLAPAKDRTSKPSRHLRISLRRLYLIELVFHLSSEERGELQRVISSAQLPSSFPRLFGPKVVARPDKLSPGEYEMLPQILEIYLMGFEHSDCPEETRPGPSLEAIARAHQELSGILWRLS